MKYQLIWTLWSDVLNSFHSVVDVQCGFAIRSVVLFATSVCHSAETFITNVDYYKLLTNMTIIEHLT